MKTLTLAIALSVITFLASPQLSVAQSADVTSIKQLIEADKAAADAADYKTYRSHWAPVAYASFLINGQQYVGDALWKQMEKIFATGKPTTLHITRTEWNIRAQGGTAFVTFSQRVENPNTKSVWETVEARYLEKIGGEWKLVNVTVMNKMAP